MQPKSMMWRCMRLPTTGSYMYALRLLNAAARLRSDSKKFYRGLSQVMHVDLH